MSGPQLEPDALYHLATVAEWDDYQQVGTVEPASLGSEGFVHCSWGRQVAGTVARHFAGVPDLLALKIDQHRLGTRLVEEDLYGSGEPFPHVYGPVPVAAVVLVSTIYDAGTSV